MACGILVPQPGIEPVPAAVEARSFNQRPTREVPTVFYYKSVLLQTFSYIWNATVLMTVLPSGTALGTVIYLISYF